MNITNDYYNDNLDGDFLACRPGHVADGLEVVCTTIFPILGSLTFINGQLFIYLAYKQRRLAKLLVKQTKEADLVLNFSDVDEVSPVPQRVARNRVSWMEKLVFSLGIVATSCGLMYLVYGFGTMYPTTHIRGQIGDVIAIMLYPALWYLSLLHQKGAKHFKLSIPQPKGTHCQIKTTRMFAGPSISTIFDIIQSWFAPLLAFGVWGLLRAGLCSRGWYHFCMLGLTGLFGLRSFACIVFLRLGTLKRIIGMVNNVASGTRAAQLRRRSFLQNKLFALVIDLFAVFAIFVLFPCSVLLVGSTFNSWRAAVHMGTIGAVCVLAMSVTNIHLHLNFNKKRKGSGITSKTKIGSTKLRSSVVPSNLQSTPASSNQSAY